MSHLDVAITCQIVFSFIALILNCILLYLILFHTRSSMGFYKYLLAGYCGFEILFAIAVFIGMPLHFVSDKTWLVFSYRGFLNGTDWGFLGPVLFCWFYENWIGFGMFNFAYRYMIVCRPTAVEKIKRNHSLKILIAIFVFFYIAYVTFCAFTLCTMPDVTHRIIDKLATKFDIPDVKQVGYVAATFHDNDGNIDAWGTVSAINHYMLIISSTIVVLFFCISIYRGIKELQKKRAEIDLKLEKQLFKVLLIQTIVPIVLSHLPCLMNLTFPFWEGLDLGPLPPFFSVLTTLQKSIDPIMTMFFINDYKKSIKRFFCKSAAIDDSTGSYHRTAPLTHSTNQNASSQNVPSVQNLPSVQNVV